MYSFVNKSIIKLLLNHDYVILPGLGGFVSQYQSAIIDEEQSTIQPPSKRISFNVNLQDNDGLLIKSLAEETQISIEESRRLVKRFVSSVFKTLNEGKSFEITQLGHLAFNAQMKIEFKVQKGENYNPHSYGMTAVACHALGQKEGTKTLKKTITFRTLGKVALWLPLFMLGLLFSLYLNKQEGTEVNLYQETASFISALLPEHSEKQLIEKKTVANLKIEDKELSKPEDIVSVNKKSSQASLLNPSEKGKTENLRAKFVAPKEPVATVSSSEKKMKFALVAGSFKQKKNASVFLKRLKINGFVKKFKGNYRVIVEECAMKSEAKILKVKHKNNNLSTWILKY